MSDGDIAVKQEMEKQGLVARVQTWYHLPNTKNRISKNLKRVSGFIFAIIRAIIMIGIGYIILSPIFGIVSNAFKDVQDVYNPLVYLIPENLTLENITMAAKYMQYGDTLLTTLGLTLGVTLLQLIVTSLTGYGFARFKFPGCNLLFGFVIVTIVVPIQAYMVPLFAQFRYFNLFGISTNLINTYAPIILLTATGMGLRSGLYVYIFRQFFKGLPKEIEEAALIDGAGQIRTFATVMMPNAVSAIITVMMFSFVWQYNDTFYSSLFMNKFILMPAQLGGVGNAYTVNETVRDPNITQLIVNAGVVLTIMPVIVFYLALQRFFMEGIERSGIVG